MFFAETNRLRQLLHLNFVGRVNVADLRAGVLEVQTLLEDMKPGFVLLTDLSRLEDMEVAYGALIGQLMELCQQRGIGRIVRVVPDPSKDIGLNILSIFHYHSPHRVLTCESMLQAQEYLPSF